MAECNDNRKLSLEGSSRRLEAEEDGVEQQ